MATPNAELIIGEFRRDIADVHDKTTGAAITNYATQDGVEWSAVEARDLLIQSINEYIQRLASEVIKRTGDDMEKLGNAMASVFPEYVKRTQLAFPLAGFPGYYGGNYGELAVPSDFAFVCAAAIAYGSDYDRARYRTPVLFASMLDHKNREHRRPYYTIEGSTIRVKSRWTGISTQAPTAPVETQLEFTYIFPQPVITLAGATDITIRMHHKTNVLAMMKLIAGRYKTQ